MRDNTTATEEYTRVNRELGELITQCNIINPDSPVNVINDVELSIDEAWQLPHQQGEIVFALSCSILLHQLSIDKYKYLIEV